MKRKIEFFVDKRPEKIQKLEESSNINTKKFNVGEHYKVSFEEFVDNAYIAVPTYKGSLLIAQYYSDKYGANLVLPASGDSENSSLKFYENPDIFLLDARKSNICRQAFLLNMDRHHATPVVYFKEEGLERLLIADSLGASENLIRIAKGLYEKTGIPVYLIKAARQADLFSCYLDALLLGIKSTAIKETGEYLISDLPSYFKKYALPIEDGVKGVFSTRLPDELLTTCQITAFLDFHKEEDSKKVIHKNETLSMFRERYTKNVLIRSEKKSFATEFRNVYSYPRVKSFKFADIMIMQFYLNQIQVNGKILLKEERMSFINEAKAILHSKTDFESKTQSLLKLTEDYSSPPRNINSIMS